MCIAQEPKLGEGAKAWQGRQGEISPARPLRLANPDKISEVQALG